MDINRQSKDELKREHLEATVGRKLWEYEWEFVKKMHERASFLNDHDMKLIIGRRSRW